MADAASCKEMGNEAMAQADYVNAMKWYSQALTFAPKDGALYSNRSFAFLRLGLSSRALADAEEAVRHRPDWAKAHFRRAEAYRHAGLHADALDSYERGAALDPGDDHLRTQCIEGRERHAAAKRRERLQTGAGAAVGVCIVAMLLVGSAEGAVTRFAALVAGALFGGLGGAAFVMLRRQQRSGSVLAPLEGNEAFAAMQMKGDRDGAGELRSTILSQPPPAKRAMPGIIAQPGGGGTPMPPPEDSAGARSGAEAKRRVRSTGNGRAAAMRALGKQA